MKKWKVRKRDGVWVVLDQAGKLRYAAAEYRMALSFALMAFERKKSLWGDVTHTYYVVDPGWEAWRDAIKNWFDHPKPDRKDEDE